MNDPMFEPVGELNPELADMPWNTLQERIADQIGSMLDMVCRRDSIDLGEDTRAEISCVSAADIVNNVLVERDIELDDDAD